MSRMFSQGQTDTSIQHTRDPTCRRINVGTMATATTQALHKQLNFFPYRRVFWTVEELNIGKHWFLFPET